MTTRHNVAIFISGRLTGYEKCLVPFIENIKHRYNIKLFGSFNQNSFDQNTKTETLNAFIRQFQDILGYINMIDYKMPYEYVQLRMNADTDSFDYNLLSEFYNDKKNLEMVEAYEVANRMKFDIICKTRADIFFYTNVNFVKDAETDRILRTKNFQVMQYWGHIEDHKRTPIYISNAFVYGNKFIMRKYCEAYDWVLENNRKFNGKYRVAGEIYVTDCILQYPMYRDIPGGGQIPLLNADEIIDKFENNPNKIKIIQMDDIGWYLLPSEERQKYNFTVNRDNVLQYTQPPDNV